MIALFFHAAMAKLADALASGAKARKGVGVQVPLAAFFPMKKYGAVAIKDSRLRHRR